MADFFGKLKSGAGKVAFDADKMVRTNRVRSEVEQLNRALEELYAGLGKAVYQQESSGIPANLAEWQAKINDKKQQIVAKEHELQAINAEVYNPGGQTPVQAPAPIPPAPPPVVEPASEQTAEMPGEPAMPTIKVCPDCSQEMPAGAKFCTNCGHRF